jgi:triacylglycerol lipase
MTYPIVLAHGIAPFDEFYHPVLKTWSRWTGWGLDRFSHFRNIASMLRRRGFLVEAPRVPFAGSVDDRARNLAVAVKHILLSSKADRVHIIAHSMGGLDARHMIVDLGMADSIATLSTIGTPHLGTSLADRAVGGNEEVLDLLRTLRIDFTGFADLTTYSCNRFNKRAEAAEAANSVRYVTWSSFQQIEQVFSLLKISWGLIQPKEGDNDGLVPTSSQQWTSSLKNGSSEKAIEQFEFPFAADHLNQLAWWDLDELTDTSWWSFAPRREIRAFEKKIQSIYLEIAQNAERIAG